MTETQNLTPFFSIGVTTYNRPELLYQTLTSICHQTFADFEVIVGNDYIQEPLSAEIINITDSRIRFINHPRNLGEIQNMNTLLNLSRGRYFTWLTDDDLYAPNFLAEVRSSLVKYDFPACVFTSFEHICGTDFSAAVASVAGQSRLLSGRQFLRRYWSGELKAMGCTAVYDPAHLKQLGGVESLAETSFALYSEHLLLVRAGLLNQVVHIDEPLVRYRIHDGSWGGSAKDLRLFKQAAYNFLHESIKIFSEPELHDDFSENIASVLEFTTKDFFNRIRSTGYISDRLQALPFLLSIKKAFEPLKGSNLYRHALIRWCCITVRMLWWLGTKFNLKAAATQTLRKFEKVYHLFLERNSKRSGV